MTLILVRLYLLILRLTRSLIWEFFIFHKEKILTLSWEALVMQEPSLTLVTNLLKGNLICS